MNFEVVMTLFSKYLEKFRHYQQIPVSVSDFLMKSRSQNLGLDLMSVRNILNRVLK